MNLPAPNWAPFSVAPIGARPEPPRSIDTAEGVGDRLRAAAFAEIQAREAFRWAADRFDDAAESLRVAWRGLAHAEDRHLQWLMNRMEELGVSPQARQVSDQLWQSFMLCKTARDFAIYMANAEERGRRAGERFHQVLLEKDPKTAEIFGKIALEEVEHIALAKRHFPDFENWKAPGQSA